GTSNAIVWSVGAEGDSRLRGFDGDTGRVIFAGGGPLEAMSFIRRFQTPIAARGRIFVAADSQLYAFTTQYGARPAPWGFRWQQHDLHGVANWIEWPPRADERKVKQVLLNLLSNALKFAPQGSRIEVRAVPVDGSVEVSVSDTGIGVAPEDQEAIFEEFRQ